MQPATGRPTWSAYLRGELQRAPEERKAYQTSSFPRVIGGYWDDKPGVLGLGAPTFGLVGTQTHMKFQNALKKADFASQNAEAISSTLHSEGALKAEGWRKPSTEE